MAKRKPLINVTFICMDCPAQKLFTAEDVNLLFKAIDLSGWHQFSDEKFPSTVKARCPKCYRKWKQEPK